MTGTALILTATLLAPQSGQMLDREFEIALGTVGLTPATARFDPTILRFYRQGEFAVPLFESCYEDPWRTPFFTDMVRRQIATAVGKPLELASVATRLTGQGSRRQLLGNPIQAAEERAKGPDALESVLARMRTQGLIKGPIPTLAGVPSPAKASAALVLDVALEMFQYRDAAFSELPDLSAAFELESRGGGLYSSASDYAARLRLYRNLRMHFLYSAMQDLGAAVGRAQEIVAAVSPTERYDARIDSEWGAIILSGGSDSTYGEGAMLLIQDTGGNDTYVNVPATQSAKNWLSVSVDSAGNDAYLSHQDLKVVAIPDWAGRKPADSKPGPGSALYGLCLLSDSSGNDLYRSHRPAFGSASFGGSMLIDAAGEDTYEGYANSLGFGHWGVGIVEDAAGKDSYGGFSQVQGVGITGGVGLLLDRNGDDTYLANDTVIDFPSAQSAEHNVNMSQGAGYGVRSDYVTGHSLSGGVGILYDLGGKDTYTCGVFGQGVGYWEGFGILWDFGVADDTYTGQWYAQGASAHFGLGYLEDEGGSDVFFAGMNMAQGAGHDFGTGYLLDRGGDDKYTAPNLSLGAGNANGFGLFVDFAGNDAYDTRGITLGQAAEALKGSIRERGLTLGVFMDLAGQDTYPPSASHAANGKREGIWRDRAPTAAESQVGVFWDR